MWRLADAILHVEKRLFEDLDIPVIQRKESLSPSRFTLGVSGEGDWGLNQTPTYKAQGKLKIHLIDRVDFPIAITYSNQTAKSRNADLKGIAGFAINFAKLTARL